jgi:tRNA (adenine37-N6)-methyltransferase
MTRFAPLVAFALVVLAAAASSAETDGTQQATPTEFKVRPIGHVQKMGERIVIVLDEKYQEGLLGLEQWSHVQVIW